VTPKEVRGASAGSNAKLGRETRLTKVSGGIHAIKGFDYQATVILDLLFEHFDRRGASARARPEGLDDLELSWNEGANLRRLHVQIKKPSEDMDGKRVPSSWTVSEVTRDLLAASLAHLAGNEDEQIWILGDAVGDDVSQLVSAGADAPTAAPGPYFQAIHLLARIEVGITQRWAVLGSLPADPEEALATVIDQLARRAREAKVEDTVVSAYGAATRRLHAILPDVLERICVRSTFGTEEEVRERVLLRLEDRYHLDRRVVRDTLFRNLRGFINDISKQPGRSFDAAELELELRSVWPVMIPIKTPPPLAAYHVPRPDLIQRMVAPRRGKAVEVVGISGSGKTSLAAEAVAQLQADAPQRAVYYAEVQTGESLRDVLAGVAFHLRRAGTTEPFGLAVRQGLTSEQVISDLARALSLLERPALLLLDLAQGTCSPSFARDLASFIKSLTSSRFQLVVLGQERPFRELLPFEQEEHGIEHIDVRGFAYEEFVTLVERFHPAPDRTVLWNVFQRLAAGRSAGLFAMLAYSLARADSLAKMQEIAALPADSILRHAEQQRFARLSEGALPAARKLVCFLLPFRRRDAEEVFPEENVGCAIRELLDAGLLRPFDDERLEMHETVRAGLEEAVAPAVRRRAHGALAAWYGKLGLVTAAILHLDKAGCAEEAHARARETFCAGKHWSSLASYVAEHGLVSPEEVTAWLVRTDKVTGRYLLPELLGHLAGPTTAEELIGAIREQAERFDGDFAWASQMVEAALACDSTKLHELILFALERREAVDGRQYARLGPLRAGARRSNVRIDRRVLDLFDRQDAQVKLRLVALLLLDKRRDVMRPVFDFIASHNEPVEWRWIGDVGSPELPLRLERPADVVELLAALPLVEPSRMLVSRSALLGPFTGFVWGQRRILQPQCIGILQEGAHDEVVLENAIRLLVFFTERTLLSLCEPLLGRRDRLGTLAKMIPALVPGLADRKVYEARLFDAGRDVAERAGDLMILSAVGVELDELLARIEEREPEHKQLWDFLFLLQAVQRPFGGAVRLLEDALSSCTEEQSAMLGAVLMKLGELPLPSVTDLLVRALASPWARVRVGACRALTQRRSRRALPALLALGERESHPLIAQIAAVAAVASGPRSVGELTPLWARSPDVEPWRWVLTARLRDASQGDAIVEAATDPTKHWQIRRAAILAAGRLPYAVAMAKIAPRLLRERSPFEMDQNSALLGHMALASLTLAESAAMRSRFVAGKARFVRVFGDILESWWKDALSRDDGLPSGSDAAGWLFDRLAHHGWPARQDAPDRVIDELHVPILQAAVLRSLRLCGELDLIEEQISSAHHVWLFMRCVVERAKADDFGAELLGRLRRRASASPWGRSPFVSNLLSNLERRPRHEAVFVDRSQATQEASQEVSRVRYDDVIAALTGDHLALLHRSPIVMEDLSAERCESLARLLDPRHDYTVTVTTTDPVLELLPGGYSIDGARYEQRGNREEVRASLRPALAAANRFGVEIAWHRELMAKDEYLHGLMDCLAALDDPARFYGELANHEDVMMPYLADVQHAGCVMKYVDARMVPSLKRYAGFGGDAVLEALCTMAARITSQEIDDVLAALFHRWTQRFEPGRPTAQHEENHALWRAFHRLAEHPRLRFVEGYDARLMEIAGLPLPRNHKDPVTRALQDRPRAYTMIESMLLRSAPFETYFRDEVDRFDEAADKLFGQILTDDEAGVPALPPGAHRIWTLEELLTMFARMSEARPLLEHALRDFERTGDIPQAAASAYRLGEIHGREGGWEAARRYFERGLEHAQRAREPSLLAEGYRLLADAAFHGSDYESARVYYEGAIRAWDALGRQQEAADARLLLVALLVQLGRARSGARHAEWLRAYGERAKLSPEGRDELERVLRLTDAAGAGERETAQ
jgi:tetratricopeptide (TPR) repeat protein/RecA/RadA recombinase